ncbi:MAG: MarR family transcriptional regulator [Flavobacteriales bacterium]|nr:MarR family transcriptional regulator [Flavobacteriales bacterium]
MKLEEEIKQKKFKDEFQKLALNIMFTGNWLSNQSIKSFKPFGISPQQYNVLRILKGQYPQAISVNSITERMLDKNSNASRLVDKLVVKKLVERAVCEKDRRQVDVAITQNGIDLLEEMKDIVESSNIQFSKKITKEEAKIMNEILDKLRE